VTSFERVDYTDPRAVALRDAMDVEMSERYGMASLSPDAARAVDEALTVDPTTIVATVLVISDGGTPVAHAALRPHDPATQHGPDTENADTHQAGPQHAGPQHEEWEIKRVVVREDARGHGIGRALMKELEAIAVDAGVSRLILQTGDRQPEAVRLYERSGFTAIPLFEPYASAMPNSLCFAKDVTVAQS
jgi:GNAT superfamily N-acetyltransferase